MSPAKDRQPGFFFSEDGAELHTHPQAGDHMVKPVKPGKPRKKGPTPYEEAIAYGHAVENRMLGFGTWEGTDLNGGTWIVDIGPIATHVIFIGDRDDVCDLTLIDWMPPSYEPLPVISDAGRGLYYALKAKGDL